ncbi:MULTISPECIES: lytic polysaccharide monooxygenase auxiliary activity family 9 protein [unclassified Streptomyces]|uniref:lytic polysaccharide monooxygenase auxiliary activity family 9 protein n=1 Tax=unclassified Streptomyces TaxID=2593676 RepID=UPI00225721B8|nr:MULTISPECIES: lytic polysaccharide monooxygenase [unclassified Streptomyces]MCX4884366.1 lytic polysaccharide monooxygenase [Streptomyces sp. NBC_00847]MCX5051820.1 lytic polysaccharide monooxygenase [Streptomyces sp. NBC_00474]MCX5062150.1 lytic polysaccharide monooxygenase [Streptomyces sp. NBC_00452]
MPRMTAHRTALTAALVTPFVLPLWAAGPAQAHGAPTDPVSRVYACSPDGGGNARSAACKAAVAANGAPFTLWDNLRVPDVAGRDRQVIPDGKLCSGGLSAYKGLDLARADWPSTTLKPGATLTMKYASTIPHTGTFKLYLTKPGYDPRKPLTWSELPEQPFATVKDPALTNGAYRITAKLPSDRTGHHVLYTIWQNSSTTDTYYSCSDVVFGAAGSGTAGGAEASASAGGGKKSASGSPSATREPRTTPSRSTEAAASPQKDTSAPDSTPVASVSTDHSGPSAPMLAGGAAAVLVLTGGAALALRLRRR